MWQQSAAAQAAAVRSGDVSAVELVEQHLTRIARINPRVNAVTQLLDEQARAAARALDTRRAAGEHLGPLAGVLFSVKESLHIEGVPTTHGTSHFRELIARADAPPVDKLRAAGAIPIGHTNMPTLTLAGVHTRSELFGDTVNPWAPSKTPGGTSGGDGVAVATGMAGIGLGNDSGGSVRLPATFNGVAGLKPSYGRFAADHRIDHNDPPLGAQMFAVDGPLARTVGDLRLAYEAMSGPDPRDPRALPVPLRGEPPATPIQIAVAADPGGQGVDPMVRTAIDAAASTLSDAGYAVAEVDDLPDLDETLEVYSGILMTEFAPGWPSISKLLGAQGHRYIEMGMEKSPPVDLGEYQRLTGRLLSIKRDWATFFARHPLLLTPVFTLPHLEPGIESRDPQNHAAVGSALRMCTVSSAIGLPAVAVPTGVHDGMPTGVQLIGGMYREDLCLDAAETIEQHHGALTPIDPKPARD